MDAILLVYTAGLLLGLWLVDGPPLTRLAVAGVWPLGVLAAVVTTVILLAVAAVLFPLFGGALAASGLLVWWLSP